MRNIEVKVMGKIKVIKLWYRWISLSLSHICLSLSLSLSHICLSLISLSFLSVSLISVCLFVCVCVCVLLCLFHSVSSPSLSVSVYLSLSLLSHLYAIWFLLNELYAKCRQTDGRKEYRHAPVIYLVHVHVIYREQTCL